MRVLFRTRQRLCTWVELGLQLWGGPVCYIVRKDLPVLRVLEEESQTVKIWCFISSEPGVIEAGVLCRLLKHLQPEEP